MSSRPLGLSAFVTLMTCLGGYLALLNHSAAWAELPEPDINVAEPSDGTAAADVDVDDAVGGLIADADLDSIPIVLTEPGISRLIDFEFLGERAPGNGKRSWGPEQAIGEPDTDGAGDIVTAWASLTPDDDDEWLLLHFDRAIDARIVEIHETYNPGAVVKITAFNADGEEVLAWEGEDPTPTTEDRGISIIPIDIDFVTDTIKVYIDSPAVPGWNEIDAIGLHDKNGEVLWASNVECSTTYADPFSPDIPEPVASDFDRPYGPEQAEGEPNTLVAGDSSSAWASATSDGQEEWLICHYENMVVPESVAVHENYSPGALYKVSVFRDGEEIVVWEGEDPTPTSEAQGISVIPIEIDFEIDTVKLYLDSVRVSSWNEIDAVALRDLDGESQWAIDVESSSYYGQDFSYDLIDFVPATPDPEDTDLRQEVEMLREEVQSLREEIQQIKNLLRDIANRDE